MSDRSEGYLKRSDSAPTESSRPGDVSPERGYYGLPVLKTPVWRWEVWAYFFCGGLAAGSFIAATLASWFGDARDRSASRIGYIFAFLALLACPPLLIKDLGRPARFLNMLRIIKPQSPMSLGVWSLVGFSGCSLVTALDALFGESPTIIGKVARIGRRWPLRAAGTGFACFLGGYTGILLSVTSVPLWSRSRWLGPTFLASAFSAGLAGVSGILALQPNAAPSTELKLDRWATVAHLAEAGALIGFFRETTWAAAPLNDPEQSGRPFWLGAVGLGIVIPLIGGLAGSGRTRHARLALAVCGLLGSLFLRMALVEGGRASAEDPAATFRHTDLPPGKSRA